MSKVLQYNDKSGLNKKSFIYPNIIDIDEVDEVKKEQKLIDHKKFIDMRNFITDCVEYKNFKTFSKKGANYSLLNFLKEVLTYFINNPLPAKFSDRFRIITVQNENVLDDNKYRIIFLLQVKIFLHSLDHRLTVHKDQYPDLSRDEKKLASKIGDMVDSILKQQKVPSSKRSIADVFTIFEHFENINVEWKNEGCPSFEFNFDKVEDYNIDELLSKSKLTRKRSGQ